MVTVGGQRMGHLIRKPGGFLIFSSIPGHWKNNADSVRFPDLVFLPGHRPPSLPDPPLPSSSHLFLSSLPLRSFFRPRSSHPSAFFFSMTPTNSSNPDSNCDGAAAPQLSSTRTVRVAIRGRVQGVFYRDWTVENATGLGLNGWVRNRRDLSVEALFSGSPDKVDEMVQRCRRGPPAAKVTDLEVFTSGDNPGPGFERKPTV
ncbi:uncharacterized protein LOC131168305 [Malania oleifera]|uniref:uncharacterized protein LOC131168305 n=1 Tax=Malania oleifera TaxID=397392 RepID=UPI0025AE1076|nr:uncharacterized protein LOC131168305 [Malania oleifera]